MQAIILAAGEGKRMRPLTLETPKPLLKVKGKPIIEYIIESLPTEVDEVIVVVKYLGDQIRSHLGSSFSGRKIIFMEGCGQGTAQDFLLTKDFIQSDHFLVFYGDELPRREDVVNCLKEELSVLVFKSSNPGVHGIVVLNANGTIKSIIEKPENPPSDLAIDGLMVLSPDIFKYEPIISSNKNGEYYLTSLLNQFVKDYDIYPVMSVGLMGDITTPADLDRIEKML